MEDKVWQKNICSLFGKYITTPTGTNNGMEPPRDDIVTVTPAPDRREKWMTESIIITNQTDGDDSLNRNETTIVS